MDIRNIKLIALAFILLFSINLVLAIGVSSPYWDQKPLKMYPGQTKEVSFTLVNKPDAGTEKAFVTLEKSAEIAEITSGSEYDVAPGTTNTKVILKITIPPTASIGDSYDVMFSVKGAPPEEEGMIQLVVGYDIDFPVEVVDQSEVMEEVEEVPEPEEKGLGTWWIAIILIVLIIIIVAVILTRKR